MQAALRSGGTSGPAGACLRNRWAAADIRGRNLVRKLALTLALLATTLTAAGPASAQTTPPCAQRVEVVVWTAINWQRVARAFADNPAPCAEYWVSIPPGTIRTNLRASTVFDQVSALGPHIHPMAEMVLGTPTGWAAWVEAEPGRTWYDAGVEFREKMVAAGLDVTEGETWLLNEFNRSTVRDGPSAKPAEPLYSRADMRELVRGLYEGDTGMPPAPGAVEIGINHTHQNMPDPAVYKEELKNFLLDSAFWADMNVRVRWMMKEAYPDARYHGVPDSTRTKRRRQMEQYLFHMIDLAAAAPKEAVVAKKVLGETSMTLGNATWAAMGPTPDFSGGHGWTLFPLEDMLHFLSEQVYAMRYYADAHPKFGPAGRLGFSWQPTNRFALSDAEFLVAQDTILARLASAVRHAYANPEAPPIDACRPPGSGEQWCNSFVPEAEFTSNWLDFAYWK
jgi:hypothetical protein